MNNVITAKIQNEMKYDLVADSVEEVVIDMIACGVNETVLTKFINLIAVENDPNVYPLLQISRHMDYIAGNPDQTTAVRIVNEILEIEGEILLDKLAEHLM
jgi:hypothetical protein